MLLGLLQKRILSTWLTPRISQEEITQKWRNLRKELGKEKSELPTKGDYFFDIDTVQLYAFFEKWVEISEKVATAQEFLNLAEEMRKEFPEININGDRSIVVDGRIEPDVFIDSLKVYKWFKKWLGNSEQK